MIRSGVLLLVLGLTLSAQERDEDLQRLSDQARSALAAKQWEQAAKTLASRMLKRCVLRSHQTGSASIGESPPATRALAVAPFEER